MSTKRNTEHDAFGLAGNRLNHILDQIGFRQGRGRMAEFQSYLTDKAPNIFGDLKYTTVRSWFQEHSPPMRKIDAAIQALQYDYTFHHDVSHIKTWWKVGGFYPFVNEFGDPVPSINELQQEATDHNEKLQFVVMSLVTEETGELFRTLSSKELVMLKDKAVQFAQDFSDPFKTECPSEYLRIVIKAELSSLLKKQTK
ncbi:hypothetical protein ACJJI4_24085 (plasmid) [Microbulbifer sp. TRSA002]|uniref:hypothetical protein n=1 Tax=Microbulbifer sp. TRSA002 TaxID=3243382 RepID=UPI00403A611F